MRNYLQLFKVTLLCILSNIAHADNLKNWDSFSSVLAVGLPSLAVYSTWENKDLNGFTDFALSQAGTVALSELIKSQHHEMRPDGSGNDIFPPCIQPLLSQRPDSWISAMMTAFHRFTMPQRYGPASPVWRLKSITGKIRLWGEGSATE